MLALYAFENISGRRSSTPGAPLGHWVKSFAPCCFCFVKVNGQWSVADCVQFPVLQGLPECFVIILLAKRRCHDGL